MLCRHAELPRRTYHMPPIRQPRLISQNALELWPRVCSSPMHEQVTNSGEEGAPADRFCTGDRLRTCRMRP
jgi:hypothetical protein